MTLWVFYFEVQVRFGRIPTTSHFAEDLPTGHRLPNRYANGVFSQVPIFGYDAIGVFDLYVICDDGISITGDIEVGSWVTLVIVTVYDRDNDAICRC